MSPLTKTVYFMKKLSCIALFLLCGCSEIDTPEVTVSQEDYGIVIDVWGCTKGGYANNSIICNVETEKHKIANVNISLLQTPYIRIGSNISIKNTQTQYYTKKYLCVDNDCSMYDAQRK